VIDDQGAALRQMRRIVERMNALVDDLFELSRLNAGPARPPQPHGPLSLVELVYDVVGEAREHARRRDVELVLELPDGCGGISDEDLSRVFEIGWRGEPERGTNDAGAGLGLAIARGVVESHAGSISVANVDGGCRFDVELPAQTRT